MQSRGGEFFLRREEKDKIDMKKFVLIAEGVMLALGPSEESLEELQRSCGGDIMLRKKWDKIRKSRDVEA